MCSKNTIVEINPLKSILFLFQYLDSIRQTIGEHLKCLAHAPSVQMQDIPQDLLSFENIEEADPDVRNHDGEISRR
jgi:hypothetical protein